MDAALVDPAVDFGRLYRDLGSAARRYRPSTIDERALFHARCSVLEDLAYGLESGADRYTELALSALDWLFTD